MRLFTLISLVIVTSILVLTSPSQAQAEVLWTADHETGDLSQYTAGNTYGGSFDSDCVRPPNGVSSEQVYRGNYSLKMTAPISEGKPGCRQFRYEESSLGHSSSAHTTHNPLYYSFWMYIPEDYEIDDWTNIVQYKSKTYSKSRNDAFWVLELRNRSNGQMYFALRYKGIYPGPKSGEGTGLKLYHHDVTSASLPARQWVFMEIYMSQSTNPSNGESNYDGQLIVKQDGVEIYNMSNIATRYPDSWDEFAVNTYTKPNGVSVNGSPHDLTLYFDDMAISTTPISPNATPQPTPAATPTPTPNPTPTPTPQGSSQPTPTPATTPQPSGDPIHELHLSASDASLTAPFSLENNYLFQANQTNITQGGKGIFSFTVPEAGEYTITALVDAPNDGNNSFYAKIDGTPTEADVWHIGITNGFELRPFEFSADQNTYTLEAGTHTITVVGREAKTKLREFVITGESIRGTNQNTICAADINQDGVVNILDYSEILPDLLSKTPSKTRHDINGDGVVNIFDYSLMVSSFLKRCDG